MEGRKRFLAAAACTILAGATAYNWYFREADHIRVASPDGEWVVAVTKRMDRLPEPVEVRLKVVRAGDAAWVWLDAHLDAPDVWSDAEPDSYRVEWTSATTFRVGGRNPAGDPRLRGRFTEGVWVVEPAEPAAAPDPPLKAGAGR